jgi:hypothetical protein
MKKFILLTAVCSLSLNMMAQDDDMYFVPTKENVAKEAESYGMPKSTYYSGSNRSVDDYNGRLSSSVTPVDSLGNEIETDDYQYTRRMTRFDDYSPSVAYWQGYRDGSWSSPWYFNRYYYSVYDPWFDPWYDTMYYYDSYYGWYSPWRYGWYYSSYYRPWGYYSWYTPIYYGGGRLYSEHHTKSPSINYYNRRNYSNNGTRRTSDGRRIDVRSGNVGSGSRTSYNSGNQTRTSRSDSGSRPSNSSFSGGSRSSSGSSMRSTGTSSGGSRSGGGGRVGGGRR